MMKRFKWRLQRVLTVTEQRETALRMELLTLLQKINGLRHDIFQRQSEIRDALKELSEQDFTSRLQMQGTVSECIGHCEREIKKLENRIDELSEKRREKTEQLKKLRKKQDVLERMRHEAREEHRREEWKHEQKEFDDNSQKTFTRKLFEQRVNSTGAEL